MSPPPPERALLENGASADARTGRLCAARAVPPYHLGVPETSATAVLDSRYRLLAQLAVGGTSTVHLATDTVLDRTVAVKILHPHLAQDAAVVDRFRREALAAASLTHPHVVTMFDVARDGSYLVMEHVDGPSLRDVLRLRGRLPAQEALSLIGPVAAGLSAAHAAGLVHRDVKPENVLLGSDGRVKIGDFGLAREAASASTTYGPDVFAGSPLYASPEAVRGDTLDARSDVYALGVVLYECLTGRPPFEADTPFTTAMLHTTEQVPAPSTAVDGVPPMLDDVVRRATDPDPDARYPDAAAFARALHDAVPAGPVPMNLRDGAGGTMVIPVDATDTVVTGATAPTTGATAGGATSTSPDTPTAPPQRSRARRLGATLRRRWWATLLVLLLVGTAGAWLTWDQAIAPVTAVPSGLVGMPVDEARHELTDAGFVPETSEDRRFSLEYERDQVIEVRPSDTARRGDVVTLVLSAGPRQVEIPGVVGESRQAAVQMIQQADLESEVRRVFHEQVPQGQVVSASPSPGTTVDEASTVELVISKGRRPIDVPSVVGLPRDQAEAALDDVGLRAEVADTTYHDEVPAGAVVSQDPGPDGGPLHTGDTVELVISDGPEPFELPDVRGEKEDKAVEMLEKLGLEVQVTYQQTFFGFGRGLVGDQSPEPGTMMVPGETVRLVVGR